MTISLQVKRQKLFLVATSPIHDYNNNIFSSSKESVNKSLFEANTFIEIFRLLNDL